MKKITIQFIPAKHNHYHSALANGEEQKKTTGFSHKKIFICRWLKPSGNEEN